MRKNNSLLNILTLKFANHYTDTHGGQGGTGDYNELSHQPQINGVVLKGNKTSAELGINPIQGVLENENLIIS